MVPSTYGPSARPQRANHAPFEISNCAISRVLYFGHVSFTPNFKSNTPAPDLSVFGEREKIFCLFAASAPRPGGPHHSAHREAPRPARAPRAHESCAHETGHTARALHGAWSQRSTVNGQEIKGTATVPPLARDS